MVMGTTMDGSKEEKMPPAKMPKPKILRPLGDLERFEAAMLALDLYRSSMVICRFSIPTEFLSVDSHAELEQKVESAIAKIVLDHSLLRVGLYGEHKRKPAFVELEAVDFSRHVEWQRVEKATNYEDELMNTIQGHLDVKVEQPEDAPSWRVLVLQFQGGTFLDVLFEWGHAHIDGISAKLFFEDLLRNLNDSSAARPEEFKNRILTIPLEKRRDLLPALHSLCKFPISMGYALSTLWKELKPPCLVGKSHSRANWAPIRLQPYTTQSRYFNLDHATLQRVLGACRAHNTTLSGLIQALVLVSLATRLTPAQAHAFATSTIVNLRPILASCSTYLQSRNVDPKHTMANFMTVVEHEFGTDLVAKIRTIADQTSGEKDSTEKTMAALDEYIWPTAQRVRADLQRRLDIGPKNDMMGLMKFIPDYRTLFKDWVKKPRAHAFALTNLGVIDGDPSSPDAVVENVGYEGGREVDNKSEDRDKWTINRAIFSISPEAHGAAFCMCPMAVKGGELYVSCDWLDCVVDVALGEGLVADLEAWLRYFGRPT
ncbi:hypothetical protein F4677DRAFT_231115 [Hypoxylon crocopeplum]|nr:hypothetical protein F4677DRAFT_231115 [Hypoxylon crocopeplum]